MKVHHRLFSALAIGVFSTCASAADFKVLMSETSPDGPLSFNPSFVKAEVGDTITFVPAGSGHNSASLFAPAGAATWKGPVDKEFSVKLDKEGIYIYACDAHRRMGMVGVVQAGNAVNLPEATKKAEEESARFYMNKDRLTKALAKVQ